MANSSTDYFQQSITFDSPDGPVSVPLPEIDDWILYMVQVCVNYGSQAGASIITLMALLLLTKPDKRLSAIMIINCLSLVFNIIRNILGCVYFSGPYAELYTHYTGDLSRVTTSNTATSVTSTIFILLVHVCVEMSLWLQVRVVCVTLRQLYQYLILVTSAILASLSIGFRLALVIENNKLILQREPSLRIAWYSKMTTIFLAVSITWFCAVFVGKLAVALRQRNKLGLRQFGPMQVLIIMGLQSMIIPGEYISRYQFSFADDAVFFSVYQYWGPPGLSSYGLTACAIFLPFSSLWASASIANRSSSTKARGNTFSTSPAGLLGTYDSHKASNGATSSCTTNTTIRNSGNLSPKDSDPDQFFFDLEKQGLHKDPESRSAKV